MKRLFLISISLLLISCSFDNKTGIWKDASDIGMEKKEVKDLKNNGIKKKYKDIFIKEKIFNREVESLNANSLNIVSSTKLQNWTQQYGVATNNISNFSHNGNIIAISKSFKLNKNLSSNTLFYKNNLISYDRKGTIFIYSLNKKKKIFEYNFYKKKFKKFKKKIFLIINDNILYVADNLGYLYAINLEYKTLEWAKNYGIPFRSNLKFYKDQIFVANQDNVIYSIDKKNGEKNWQFATTTTFLKSDFKNNFAVDKINHNLFFLNTSGELYSINYLNQNINWVVNFKERSMTGDMDLFLSFPIIIKKNNLIISTERSILSYDSISANKIWSFVIKPILKPVVTKNHTYAITENNLLICIDNITGKISWSKNIYNELSKIKIKKKIEKFNDLKIVNKKINLYSQNGYLLSFNSKTGNLGSFNRISKNGISSEIFFIDNQMFLIDNKKRLISYN
jgi:outer membrane protein assembly factor BamB